MKRKCKRCGKEFEVHKPNKRYCSDECMALSRIEQKRKHAKKQYEKVAKVREQLGI